jgi:hypothetical protein
MITLETSTRINRPDRGRLRLRLRSAQPPALELSGPSRAQDLSRRHRHRLDLPDGAGASDRPRRQRARGRDARVATRVRHPNDGRPDTVPLTLRVLRRERRDRRAPQGGGRPDRSRHPCATACPARGQEGCRRQLRDVEADPRNGSLREFGAVSTLARNEPNHVAGRTRRGMGRLGSVTAGAETPASKCLFSSLAG